MVNLDALVKICTQNIEEELSQSEAQYTERFTDIQDEIGLLTSITSQTPDYDKIVEDAKHVLGNEAKHLKPLCYLIFSLYQLEEHRGLASGLEILAKTLTDKGDDIYPSNKKKRARTSIFEWLRKQLANKIQKHDLSKCDLSILEKIHESCIGIENWMSAYYAENKADFINTFRAYRKAYADRIAAIEQQQAQLNEEQNNPSEFEHQESPAAENVSAQNDKVEIFHFPLDSDDEITEEPEEDIEISNNQQENNQTTTSISQFENASPIQAHQAYLLLLQQTHIPLLSKKLNPDYFQLHRTILWGTGILGSPRIEDRVFQDFYPTEQYQTALTLYSAGEYKKALVDFEKLFFVAPFHFEIQYYQSQCLSKLNQEKQAQTIQNIIAEHLKKLIITKPSLLSLKCAKNLYCASAHVLEWLYDEVIQINLPPASKILNRMLDDDITILAKQLQARIQKTPKILEKISLQLTLATNFKKVGQDEQATKILEKIYETILSKSFIFESYPDLCAQICIELHQSYEKLLEQAHSDTNLIVQKDQLLTIISEYCPDKYQHKVM